MPPSSFVWFVRAFSSVFIHLNRPGGECDVIFSLSGKNLQVLSDGRMESFERSNSDCLNMNSLSGYSCDYKQRYSLLLSHEISCNLFKLETLHMQ
jgi:hypothetical protein